MTRHSTGMMIWWIKTKQLFSSIISQEAGIHERHIVCLPFAFSEIYIMSHTIFQVWLSLIIDLDFDHLLILLNFEFFNALIQYIWDKRKHKHIFKVNIQEKKFFKLVFSSYGGQRLEKSLPWIFQAGYHCILNFTILNGNIITSAVSLHVLEY